MTKQYPLATGDLDKLRLEILHRLYGPGAHYFLLQQGLQPGMTVLEFGCGMGDMACWLAEQVGPDGKVIAIDTAENSLQLARDKAAQQHISNIEFLNLDINEVETLGQQFDFVYDRWVLLFLTDPYAALRKIYNAIKPKGIFTYETADVLDRGYFSYPESDVLVRWFSWQTQFHLMAGRELDFGRQLYGEFKLLGLSNIKMYTNQPPLISAEDKSVLRLAVENIKDQALQFMQEAEYEQFITDAKAFEQSDAYAGFFRNIIIAGKK